MWRRSCEHGVRTARSIIKPNCRAHTRLGRTHERILFLACVAASGICTGKVTPAVAIPKAATLNNAEADRNGYYRRSSVNSSSSSSSGGSANEATRDASCKEALHCDQQQCPRTRPNLGGASCVLNVTPTGARQPKEGVGANHAS